MMSKQVNQALGQLLGQVRNQCGLNNREHKFATSKQLAKVHGFPEPGSRLRIVWDDGDIVDQGYLFTLPGHEDSDVWMGGIVHVPSPDNPGGMDAPPPEWVTFDDLIRNVRVKAIEVEDTSDLQMKVANGEARIAMAIARLGGTVEGQTTSALNFLQRIDELRRIEAEKQAWTCKARKTPEPQDCDYPNCTCDTST